MTLYLFIRLLGCTRIFFNRTVHLNSGRRCRVKQRQSGKPSIKNRSSFQRDGKMHTLNRSLSDRRSGKKRRKILSLHRLRYKGSERRVAQDRRSQFERRDGWVRITKWSSVKMQDLKIAKFLIKN